MERRPKSGPIRRHHPLWPTHVRPKESSVMQRFIESLESRRFLSVTASFIPSAGILSVLGDSDNNTIVVSRDAAGEILVNGSAVAVVGGTPTVANTSLIQVFGQDGNDTISLDETNGALPKANLFGGNGND